MQKEMEEKAQLAAEATHELARSEFANEDMLAKIIQLDNKMEQHREEIEGHGNLLDEQVAKIRA